MISEKDIAQEKKEYQERIKAHKQQVVKAQVENIQKAHSNDGILAVLKKLNKKIYYFDERDEIDFGDALPTLLDRLIVFLRDSINTAVIYETILAVLHLGLQNQTTNDFLQRKQAMPLILRLLGSEHVLTAQCAAVTIGNFMGGSKSRSDAVFQMGVIPSLIPLLDSQDIQTRSYTTYALAILAECSDEIRQVLYKCGLISKCVELLQAEIPDEVTVEKYQRIGVKTEAALAISNLTVNSDEIIKAIIEANAIPTLVELLKSDSDELHESAGHALSKLAILSGEATELIYKAGAIPFLDKLLESNYDSVKKLYVVIVNRLASQSDEIREALICAKVMPHLESLHKQGLKDCAEELQHALEVLKPCHKKMMYTFLSKHDNTFFATKLIKMEELEEVMDKPKQDHVSSSRRYSI